MDARGNDFDNKNNSNNNNNNNNNNKRLAPIVNMCQKMKNDFD